MMEGANETVSVSGGSFERDLPLEASTAAQVRMSGVSEVSRGSGGSYERDLPLETSTAVRIRMEGASEAAGGPNERGLPLEASTAAQVRMEGVSEASDGSGGSYERDLPVEASTAAQVIMEGVSEASDGSGGSYERDLPLETSTAVQVRMGGVSEAGSGANERSLPLDSCTAAQVRMEGVSQASEGFGGSYERDLSLETSTAMQVRMEGASEAAGGPNVRNLPLETSTAAQVRMEGVSEASAGSGGSSRKDLTPEEMKRKQFIILKNVILISFANTVLYTSYDAMAALSSSIHRVHGTVSLSTYYGVTVLSCCFLPPYLLALLKEKYSIVASMICFCTFFAAQFYPRIYTLVATSVLMGLGTGSLWSAICTYITKISSIYAELVGEKTDIIVSKFFGIVFMFFQSSKLWGSLISSLVLSVEVKDANVTEKALHCGYNSCNAESVGLSNSSYSGGSEGSVLSNLYILATIFLIASLLAPVIIVIFVDPLSRFINIDESRSRSKSSLQLLVATFNHLRHPYQLLLIPISAVVGFNTGTLMADYTAAYISCVLGVHMVGYIIVCFGASSAVCALGMSLLVKVLGLVTVFTLGFLINLGLILVMIFWVPQPDDMIWFFIIGGIWGLSDAIWQTQVTVLYAVIFPKQMDEAFTNSVLWMCFGYSASYASSSVLCLNSKVIIFIILLVLGILGYYAIETIEKMGGLKKTVDGNVIPLDRLIT